MEWLWLYTTLAFFQSYCGKDSFEIFVNDHIYTWPFQKNVDKLKIYQLIMDLFKCRRKFNRFWKCSPILFLHIIVYRRDYIFLRFVDNYVVIKRNQNFEKCIHTLLWEVYFGNLPYTAEQLSQWFVRWLTFTLVEHIL